MGRRERSPTADQDQLSSLQQRAEACRAAGNYRSAIVYEAELETLLRSLVKQDRSHLPALAESLMRTGMDWLDQRMLANAEKKLRQAERIYRGLARRDPTGSHTGELANAVYRLACLTGIRTDSDRAALPGYEEAVDLFCYAAQRNSRYTELYHDAALALLELYQGLGMRLRARRLRRRLGL